jgi:hypothetical protein
VYRIGAADNFARVAARPLLRIHDALKEVMTL